MSYIERTSLKEKNDLDFLKTLNKKYEKKLDLNPYKTSLIDKYKKKVEEVKFNNYLKENNINKEEFLKKQKNLKKI